MATTVSHFPLSTRIRNPVDPATQRAGALAGKTAHECQTWNERSCACGGRRNQVGHVVTVPGSWWTNTSPEERYRWYKCRVTSYELIKSSLARTLKRGKGRRRPKGRKPAPPQAPPVACLHVEVVGYEDEGTYPMYMVISLPPLTCAVNGIDKPEVWLEQLHLRLHGTESLAWRARSIVTGRESECSSELIVEPCCASMLFIFWRVVLTAMAVAVLNLSPSMSNTSGNLFPINLDKADDKFEC